MFCVSRQLLALNVAKTEWFHFRKPIIALEDCPKLSFDNHPILNVSKIKYLDNDEHLKGGYHITFISNKVASRIGIVKK